MTMTTNSLWNRCFLCSTPLKALQLQLDGNMNSDLKTNHYKILLQYLLNDFKNKNPLTTDLLEFVGKNATINKKSQIPTAVANLCAFCEKLADSIVVLQLELEMIQMKIVDKLSTVKKSVISNSRLYGENTRVKQDWDEFEEIIKQKESDGINCEQERKFAEAIHQFQTLVFTNDVSCNQIPLVYLEKYTEKTITPLVKFEPRVITVPPIEVEQNIILNEIDSYDIKLEPIEHSSLLRNADIDEESNFDNLSNGYESDPYVPPVKKRNGRRRQKKYTATKKKNKVERVDPNSVGKAKSSNLDIKKSKRSLKSALVSTCERKSRRVVTKPSTYKDTAKPSSYLKNKPVYGTHLSNVEQLYRQLSREIKAKRKAENIYRKIWKCYECMFETRSLHRLIEQHLRTHETSEKTMKCPECQHIAFTTKQALELHLLHHMRHKNCDICNDSIAVADMESHLQIVHNSVFTCPRCVYCFGIFENLVNHAFEHPGLELKCGLCPEAVAKEYRTRTDLPRHLFESHGCADQLHKCDHPGCDKTYHGIDVLKSHQMTHTGRHECNKCSKSFVSKHTLMCHNRRHHPEEAKSLQLACDSCDALFPASDPLLKHKIVMHNHPKIECDYCNPKTEFMTKGAYQMHIRVHHGKGKKFQNFSCSKCGKKFVTRNRLESHEASHLGIKNYTCEVCGYATFFRENLQNHSRIHKERERKYKCSYCEKGFYRRDALDNHIRTHTRERPFQCEECGAAFTQRGPLKAHKMKQHAS